MSQFGLQAGYEALVNPLFGGQSADLPYDRAEVPLREAHLIGIEPQLVFLLRIPADEVDETVVDSLFARIRRNALTRVIDAVIMAHQRCNKAVESRAVRSLRGGDHPKNLGTAPYHTHFGIEKKVLPHVPLRRHYVPQERVGHPKIRYNVQCTKGLRSLVLKENVRTYQFVQKPYRTPCEL